VARERGPAAAVGFDALLILPPSRLEQASKHRAAHRRQVLRDRAAVVDEQHPALVPQAGRDRERLERRPCSLPRPTGHRHDLLAAAIDGGEVQVQVAGVAPLARPLVGLTGDGQTWHGHRLPKRVLLGERRVERHPDRQRAGRVEVGEVLRDAQAAQCRPGGAEHEVDGP